MLGGSLQACPGRNAPQATKMHLQRYYHHWPVELKLEVSARGKRSCCSWRGGRRGVVVLTVAPLSVFGPEASVDEVHEERRVSNLLFVKAGADFHKLPQISCSAFRSKCFVLPEHVQPRFHRFLKVWGAACGHQQLSDGANRLYRPEAKGHREDHPVFHNSDARAPGPSRWSRPQQGRLRPRRRRGLSVRCLSRTLPFCPLCRLA